MENANGGEGYRLTPSIQMPQEPSTSNNNNRYGWRVVGNKIFEAVKFTFDSVGVNTNNSTNTTITTTTDAIISTNNINDAIYTMKDDASSDNLADTTNEPDNIAKKLYCGDKFTMSELQLPQDLQDTDSQRCHPCEDNAGTTIVQDEQAHGMQQSTIGRKTITDSAIASVAPLNNNATESTSSIRSVGSFVCRICHNAECPERLVSPCLCKGTLTYVHIYCLEHWISTSGKTKCELCQFQYKTIQTLRYTCLQSLRMWYSHTMSRRALQEDCQMFSLLTLVAFGIVGTILVGIQYYLVQEKNSMPAITRIWTKGWLVFFLFTTFIVYFVNVYLIVRGHLSPWYRWWQSAREIKLILENRKTVHSNRRLIKPEATPAAISAHLQDAYRTAPIVEEDSAMGTVFLNLCVGDNGENDGRRHALLPSPIESDDIPTTTTATQEDNQQCQQPQDEQQQYQDDRNQVVASTIEI